MGDSGRFGWDDAKAAANLAKHGVRFEFAARLLDGALVDVDASRIGDGEERRKAISSVDGRLFTVVYTSREGVIRIIAVRRANAKERRSYASVYP